VSVFEVAWPIVLLLGGLIFVHELGHFLVAKLFGVKVEKFSIGFGPAVVKRRVGETEYMIAWFPLGGYVKMLGELPGEELPEAERERAITQKPIWQRIGVAFAGPAMNLALPVFVLGAVYMVGVPTPTTLIGGVVPDSPAAHAGLEPGDRIVAVGGEPIWRWRDLTREITAGGADPVSLVVERDGERRPLRIAPAVEDGTPRIGIDHSPPAAVVSVDDPRSLAARAGLRSGDRIASVEGRAIESWYGLVGALRAAELPVELEVARRLDGLDETIRVALRGDDGDPAALGLRPVDSLVALVESGSPADQAGLRKGDLILAVDGAPLQGFAAFAEGVRSGGGAPLALTLLRDGREVAARVRPEPRPVERDGEISEVWAIGVHAGAQRVSGETRDEVERNPLRALWSGAERTTEIFGLTVVGIVKLATRQVGLQNVAGPIGIGKIAVDSYRESWFQFFWVMAVISVNLAILNLLPIPILDGGQILFALAEAVKGSSLSLRAREAAQQVGLSLLLLLMGFAFWNDLSRYWSKILGFFQDLV
jgi:regulator of sigma E protease